MEDNNGKFYLTTAIPYVNAAPHIGHVLEFIQTDVIARYQMSKGKEVQLITGADENSLKNVQAAEKLGITVAQLCDKNSEIFKEMAKKIGLSYTSFQRTSNKQLHWPGVQKVWELCDKNKDIYTRKYRGLYCVGCEAFYDESELNDGICPEHRTKPEVVEEENYFFRLSNYQDKLEKLIENGELKIVPESRRNEVLSFIKGGLKDFSISRSINRAKGWGVPVPNDTSQIQYVWFDALGTYITGIGYGTDDAKFKKFWPADVHVIGKGILRFHAVYWPAMLLSAGLKLPKAVMVHGYITVNGQKMSKSLGNIVDPFGLIDKYGVDPVRYCLLSEVPTFEDGDFSDRAVMETNNNELLANLGNLVNRTLVFIKNNFDGKIPATATLNEADNAFLSQQKKLITEIESELEQLKIKDALHKTMQFSRNANKYFQDNKAWESIKDQNSKARAETAINILANQVKDLAILIAPYLPGTSSEIFSQLSISPERWAELGKQLPGGHQIGNPKTLFRRIEQKEIGQMKSEAAAKTVPEKPKFTDLDIEVGQVLGAQKHPDADKLFIEKILFGDGERQIVSGLAAFYSPEQLIGKKIIVLKNLAPAKIRGVESQGMVLTGESKDFVPDSDGKALKEVEVVEVIECENSKVGEKVTIKGEKEKQAPKKVITFKEFEKIELTIKGFAVLADGKQLATESEELKMKNVKNGTVR